MIRLGLQRKICITYITFFLILFSCGSETDRPGEGPKNESFTQKLLSLRWVCYSPTGYNPFIQNDREELLQNISDDLEQLKEYGFTGVITFGLTNGLDLVPGIARQKGLSGVIAGIWDPFHEGEIGNAIQLAQRSLVDALCIGNEGLGSRYQWEDLEEVRERIRATIQVPITTTEQIEDYQLESPVLEMDFLLPTIHPIWHGFREVEAAVEWLTLMVSYLSEPSISRGKPVLVKETGFPSGGVPFCTEDLQANFYRLLLSRLPDPLLENVHFALFEAFDVVWKHESFNDGDIGPHWGFFTVDRQAKKVLEVFDSYQPGGVQ